VAAGADLGVGLVVGDVGVALHAVCAVGAHLRSMDVVAGGALEMALSSWVVWNPVKARELDDLVAARASRLCCHRPPMRLVTRRALAMSLGAFGHLIFMAASARDQSRELVGRSFVTRFAAGMPEISAS
jgi:hypothetical protein